MTCAQICFQKSLHPSKYVFVELLTLPYAVRQNIGKLENFNNQSLMGCKVPMLHDFNSISEPSWKFRFSQQNFYHGVLNVLNVPHALGLFVFNVDTKGFSVFNLCQSILLLNTFRLF